MITLENYAEQTKDFDFGTDALKEGDKFLKEFGDLYNEDATIKQAIDAHLAAVNKIMEEKKAVAAAKQKQKKGNAGAGSKKDMQRINEMVAHYKKHKWASSNVANDDALFFKKTGLNPETIGITSFTGNDIIYYDTKKLYPRGGSIIPIPKEDKETKRPATKPKPRPYSKQDHQKVVNSVVKKIQENPNMPEEEVIKLGLELEKSRRQYIQKADEGKTNKLRLSPKPENLIRWAKHPGKYDLIGVDSFNRTDPTADYKHLIAKQKLFNLFNIKA